VRQQQFISQHIYGAVCPLGRKAASIVATGVCSKAMQLHLDEIALHIAPEKHAVLVMDRAGWHRSKALRIPKNMSFLHLPPYSPELNPQESVWRVLRDRCFHNRSYKSADEITEVACKAWNSWISNPEEIFSLCHRSWATL